MSFSGDVKEELSYLVSTARHCQIAELAALVGMCGSVCISASERYSLKIHTENQTVARKCFTLLQKTFNISSDVSVRLQKRDTRGNLIFTILVKRHEDVIRVLQALKLFTEDGEISEQMSPANQLLVQKSCCRRAFIRGAFLAAGSISDPVKSYHFEIACASMARAEQLQMLIRPFGPDAKIVQRKKYYIVYIKEGAQIVDMLNIMEAHVSLMNLENIRIVREMRNAVNRKVNCEAANINKTVNAAVKQLEDIRYLERIRGIDSLPAGLADIAQLRLENPDATLKELGMMLTPSVGKSGVNHRLRKLSQLAEELRQNKEENYYD
ncbi:MAG: DNA-binding protein WhiA [Lachnospiraceae bacterium]|nr:DNA-binding protein WhiA [Lachnospiraceae bacterium]